MTKKTTSSKVNPDGSAQQSEVTTQLPEGISETLADQVTIPGRVVNVEDGRGSSQPVALLPPDWTHKALGDLFPKQAPTFREGVARPADTDSFVAYVARHQTPASVIYATQNDSGGGIVQAVLDDGEPREPGRRVDRAVLALQPDPRFVAWANLQQKPVGQRAFIEFIRDHEREFITPSGAEMRTLVNGLDLKKTVNFKHVERDAGAAGIELVYMTDTQQQQSVQFPESFTILVPLLRHCPPVSINARILFDINDGVLTFVVRLADLHILLEAAWQEVLSKLREALPDVLVLNGAPA